MKLSRLIKAFAKNIDFLDFHVLRLSKFEINQVVIIKNFGGKFRPRRLVKQEALE